MSIDYKSKNFIDITKIKNPFDLKEKNEIFVLGFPLTDNFKLSKGVYSGMEEWKCQLNISVNGGNWGGPVFQKQDNKYYLNWMISSRYS